MRYIAVDPGGKTGIAEYDTAHDTFISWEDPHFEAVIQFICDATASEGPNLVVICEGFRITSKTHKLDQGAFEQTLDIIGACHALCVLNGSEFVRNYPSDKEFGSDAHLRRLGWWYTGGDGHANDAARHLLHRMAKIQFIPVLQRLTSEGDNQ